MAEDKEKKGSFLQNILTKKKTKKEEPKTFDLEDKKDEKDSNEPPSIIDSILSIQEDSNEDPLINLPETDEDIQLPKVEKSSTLTEKKLTAIFSILAILSIGTFTFFYTQLEPSFNLLGPNISQKIQTSESEIKSHKTQVNENTYLLGAHKIQELGFNLNKYFSNKSKTKSAFVQNNQKSDLEIEQTALIEDIKSGINTLKEVFKESIYIEPPSQASPDKATLIVEYQSALKDSLTTELENPTYQTAHLLVNNKGLITSIKAFNTNDLTDEKLKDLLTQITITEAPELLSVTKVQTERINWSEMISNIENITSEIDVTYGSDLFSQIGGIRYNNFSLDKLSKSLNVNGVTKTDTGKNFTLIANLIDAFENSEIFKNVEIGGYRKSNPDVEGFFSSPLSLNFELENNE